MDGRAPWVILPNADAVALRAARLIEDCASPRFGRISICLTGGSSPRKLYERLGGEDRARMPWDRIHWFIGDDRMVPDDDALNNMGAARRIFLHRCAAPASVHPMSTLSEPDAAASKYETELQAFYGAATLDLARPLFDVVLLGVGPDGHTASLFPGSSALDEPTRWAVGVERANVAPYVPRVTLTPLALQSCRLMLFIVTGAEKRDIAARVAAGEDLPAARLRSQGETVWLLDRAAAGGAREQAL